MEAPTDDGSGGLWAYEPPHALGGESGQTEEPLPSIFRCREGRAISPAPRVSRAPGALFPGHPLT